jgi:hypothetical protein
VPRVLFLVLAAVASRPDLAGAGRTDFSGAYTLKASKAASKILKRGSWTLRVVQGDPSIEISILKDGKLYDYYDAKLDGTQASYKSPGGPSGICRAQFKGGSLVLDTLVTTRPPGGSLLVQMHTRERWTLSSDGRTLTIRRDVDVPSEPLNGLQVVEPWSETYTRD